MKKIPIFLKKYDNIIFLLLFYGVFHFLCTPDYWDDASYSRLLEAVNNNVFEYLSRMYRMQTSRMGIEAVSALVCMAPHIVWRILDLVMIWLLYYDLKWFAEHIFQNKPERQQNWLLTLLVCAYPFATMACTGWKVTTMNYLWVVSLGLYAADLILKTVVCGRKLVWWENILLVLAVIYSASFESLAPVMLLGLVISCLYIRRRKERIPAVFGISMASIVVLLILVALCPGNQNRLADDIAAWMPEFEQLYLWDKLRMGIVTAFMHFVSIPSPIFFLLSIVGLAGVWIKDKCVWKRGIAACPLLIDIGWTGYYLMQYVRGTKAFTYQVPSPVLTSGREMTEQIGIFISAVIWIGAVLYCVYEVLENRKKFFVCLAVLLIGCIPEVIVGMSPTVVNSMLRTVIYLYVAMIIIFDQMEQEIRGRLQPSAIWNKLFLAVLLAGTLLNAAQMLRHIWIYG